MWAGGLAALTLVGLVWLAWPDAPALSGPAGGAPEPDRSGERAPEVTSHALRGHAARFIEVAVTSCRREAGVGVEVIAERDGYTYSARAGERGLARIDVEGDGEVTVRARIGLYRTEPVPADGGRAAIIACPGATVHGIVRDGSGIPEPERIVQLVDVAGELIDEIESDEDGAYLLTDPMLEGTALVIPSDGVDDEATRELRQLAPREDRELDLIVGEVRTVVGWVLDLNGEPQPSVIVTASAEAFGSRWLAITDAGGAFTFEGVPAASIRVEANGGDLGQAAARVAESDATRRELTLTLEPTAHITVLAPELEGRVVLRCWDPRYHGADGLQGPPVTAGLGDAGLWEDPAIYDDPGVYDDTYDDVGEIEDPAYQSSLSTDVDHMMSVFEGVLRDYDSTDPEGSVVRMLQTMMTELPEMRESLAMEGGGELPTDPVAEEAFLRELVAEEMRDNPEQFEMFGKLAAEVQSGKSLLEASQAAYGAWDDAEAEPLPESEPYAVAAEPAWDEPAAVEVAEPVVGVDYADPDDAQWVSNDDARVELDEIVVDSEAGELVYPDYQDAPLDLAGLPATAGQRSQAATGAIGARIAVRASFSYEIVILGDDGGETYVGTAFLNPGDDLVMTFGDAGKMQVGGRVVDVDGRPIPGISVSSLDATGTSDSDGRFALEVDTHMAGAWDIGLHDPAGRYETTTRRNITMAAGAARDVGTIVMRTADEEPPGQMYEPYGGIGGLVSLDSLGVRLVDVEQGTPLEMSGIEAGDTITTIDGVPAAELPMNELLLRLRGDAGTTVQLRIRTDSGELYDVGVQREVVQPRSSWEPAYDFEEPEILLE